MTEATHIMAWDPDIPPKGSGDPETDATPETLLYIARSVWRMFAPDPGEVAALGRLSRAQRAGILFWLGPLESLVRAILFLLLSPESLVASNATNDAPDEPASGAPSPPPPRPPASPPQAPASAPCFRYWKHRRDLPDQIFDLSEPDAAAAFADFLAARRARNAAARQSALVSKDHPATPVARRMIALLGVLSDPLAHVDRLATLIARHKPVMQFAPARARPSVAGPRPPCAHALERARNALRRAADPLIGPLWPYWSSG